MNDIYCDEKGNICKYCYDGWCKRWAKSLRRTKENNEELHIKCKECDGKHIDEV